MGVHHVTQSSLTGRARLVFHPRPPHDLFQYGSSRLGFLCSGFNNDFAGAQTKQMKRGEGPQLFVSCDEPSACDIVALTIRLQTLEGEGY
jgi:hypothetical protein